MAAGFPYGRSAMCWFFSKGWSTLGPLSGLIVNYPVKIISIDLTAHQSEKHIVG